MARKRGNMKITTLCYIEKNDQFLMLHRTAKEDDPNKDKWIGVGGKVEEGESPEECLLREVKEETGLELLDYKYRGIITFTSDQWESEYMHLYTSDRYQGDLGNCDEGILEWVDKEEVMCKNVWEGDKVFLPLIMEESSFFSLKLEYVGWKLIKHTLKKW